MRILLFTTSPYGLSWHEGVTNIIHRLAQYLEDQRDEVLVVFPRKI